MKNKIKLLIIIFTLFLTGCSAEYNLRIDSNLNFKEEATLFEKNEILEVYNKNLKLVPDQKFSQYESSKEFKPYKLAEKIFESSQTGGVVEANFKGVENFENSILFTSLFSELNITKYSNIVSFQTSGYDSSFFVPEDPMFVMEPITVNIRFHNEVVENNALKYDEKTNTYTWFLNEEQSSGNIMFSINQNKKRYDIILQDFFGDNLISIIVFSVIIIAGISVYIYFINKNKKINKI